MTDIADIKFPDAPFDVVSHCVLMCKRGSEAHGTFVPTNDPAGIDDRDIVGVVVPPVKFYVGMKRWSNASSIKDEWDVELHELGKFVSMLCKQNPNALSALWVEHEDIVAADDVGRQLLESRALFRHRRRARDAFVGYAKAQMERMMRPGKLSGYMGAKRRALVERFGFDCKNAAHLVRLLHMGFEYARFGELRVKRTWDRDNIVAIKRGEWSLQDVLNYAKEWFDIVEEAFEKSVLPESIDEVLVDDLVVKLIAKKTSVEMSTLV